MRRGIQIKEGTQKTVVLPPPPSHRLLNHLCLFDPPLDLDVLTSLRLNLDDHRSRHPLQGRWRRPQPLPASHASLRPLRQNLIQEVADAIQLVEREGVLKPGVALEGNAGHVEAVGGVVEVGSVGNRFRVGVGGNSGGLEEGDGG